MLHLGSAEFWNCDNDNQESAKCHQKTIVEPKDSGLGKGPSGGGALLYPLRIWAWGVMFIQTVRRSWTEKNVNPLS